MKRALLYIVVWLFAAVALLGGDRELDFAKFVRDLTDLEALSRIDGVPAKMEASYDRSGGNDDGFNPAWLKDRVYTIADLEGPGVIRRMWTARPGGQFRVYLDGSDRPIIDMPTVDFFAARRHPFERPIVGPMGGGNYSYFPIPFAESIKIQITPLAEDGDRDQKYGAYHHVNYEQFPPGTPVRSLTLPLSESERAVLAQAQALWRNPGSDPKRTDREQSSIEGSSVVKPGQTLQLGDIAGPGAIDALYLDFEPRDPKLLRELLFRIRWDDQRLEAVDTPLGDFFGNGFDFVPFKSLPMGLTEEGFYCYFSMPFAERAQLTIQNESELTQARIKWRLVYHRTDEMASTAGYFHAKWRRESVVGVNMHLENKSGDYNYRFLEASGSGRYIGASLNVFNHYFHWWGEGDHMIFVDDEVWPPAIHGTGTEEYFNDAWGFHDYIFAPGAAPDRREQNVNATSGVLIHGLGSGHYWGPNSVFVFHIVDSVPFKKRIVVSLEHGSENEMTNDYASTAYWYAAAPSRDFFVMRPVEERRNLDPVLWETTRQQKLQQYGVSLRRQLENAASAVQGFPTDHWVYRPRVRLLRYVVRNYDLLGLTIEQRDRIQQRTNVFRQLLLEERWPIIDEVLLEAAEMLEGKSWVSP
jgi:hypothetical protein